MDQGLKKGENLWDLGLLGKEFLDDAKSMIHKREETDKLDLIKIKSFYSVRSGSVSQSVMSDFLETPWTVALQAPLSMELSRQDYWSGLPFSPPGDLPNPGTEPKSPALQADSLLSQPPGKPRNTGVGCLSLLQGIFLTQESNQGLLHCKQILYQLSHQGSPYQYLLISN